MLKIYDYTCEDCGTTEERMVRDDAPQHCTCGKLLSRNIPAPSFNIPGMMPCAVPKGGTKPSEGSITTKKIVTGGK